MQHLQVTQTHQNRVSCTTSVTVIREATVKFLDSFLNSFFLLFKIDFFFLTEYILVAAPPLLPSSPPPLLLPS